jgi:hypothetical protein
VAASRTIGRSGRGAAAAAALLLAGAGLAGCGGGDGAEADVEALVRGYVAALVAGDGARGCDLMTDEVREAFAGDVLRGGCAAGFRRASRLLGPPQRDLLRDARVDVEGVDGDRARATIRVPGGLRTSVEARRVGDRWRFATLPQDEAVP